MPDTPKVKLLPCDIVKIKSIHATGKFIGIPSAATRHIGRIDTVISSGYDYRYVYLQNSPYTWHANDMEVVSSGGLPKWMLHLLDSEQSPLQLVQCFDLIGSKGYTYTKRTGSCFQGYRSAKMQWEEYCKPNETLHQFIWHLVSLEEHSAMMYGKSWASAQHQWKLIYTELSKTMKRWWLRQWRKLDVFPPTTRMRDMMNGKLILDYKYIKGTNHIYLPVCIYRHIIEQPDLIRSCYRLVTKHKMHFLTALCLTALLYHQRGHCLAGSYFMPMRRNPDRFNSEGIGQFIPLWIQAAMGAVTYARYLFDGHYKKDKTTAVFNFMQTMKTCAKTQETIKTEDGKPTNRMALVEKLEAIIKSFDDLLYFNPITEEVSNA